MNPRVLIALTVLAASLFAGVLIAAAVREDPEATTGKRFAGAVVPDALRAPDFALRDQDGERMTMRALRGKPVLVSFLYTHCEDTCPTQAVQMRVALDKLGEDVPATAIAIAVDPARDTEESARAFLAKQKASGRIGFALGSRERLAPLWQAYGVEPQLDQLEHTARFVLVDPRGRQRVSFPIDRATPEDLAHDLRLLADGA